MEQNNDYFNNNEPPRQKPHIIVQIFLALYAMLWMTMLFATGLNSLYLGHVDYDSLGYFLGMTFGYYFILKYF